MGARFDSAELRALFGIPETGSVRTYTSVSTDTRSLAEGALFVALQGERFDGADFLEQAHERGARGALLPSGRERPDLGLEWFPVEDTTLALGDLARHYRRRSPARVVAITGSSGKTTVKEMLVHALGGGRSVHGTPGNLNNLIGLPLSILAAPETAEIWVLELGANTPGEIARLTSIAEPDDAVITTVGPAHLAGFGSEKGVLEEKLDLVRGSSAEGLAVVGERPVSLPRAVRALRADVVVAGLSADATYRPDTYAVAPTALSFTRGDTQYHLPVGGEHHLRDALVAAATAEGLGVTPVLVAEGLARYRPVGMRGALRQAGDLTVVADCYNANPESFGAAIRYCAESFPQRRLAAVVGTMLELGSYTEEAHRSVARQILDAGFDLIVAIGEFGAAFRAVATARNGATITFSDDADGAWDVLTDRLDGDEVVLVKASRGVRLEGIVDRLTVAYGKGDE